MVNFFRLSSRKGISLHSKAFIPALDLIHTPIQWLPAAPDPGIKRLGSKADHSFLLVWRLRMRRAVCIHSQVLNSAQGQCYCHVIVLSTAKNNRGRPEYKAII
jgi:hypothetical protein